MRRSPSLSGMRTSSRSLSILIGSLSSGVAGHHAESTVRRSRHRSAAAPAFARPQDGSNTRWISPRRGGRLEQAPARRPRSPRSTRRRRRRPRVVGEVEGVVDDRRAAAASSPMSWRIVRSVREATIGSAIPSIHTWSGGRRPRSGPVAARGRRCGPTATNLPNPSDTMCGSATPRSISMTHSACDRQRFPGVRDGWARFDGPAGTQMVDTAIEAMADVGGERRQRQLRRCRSPPPTPATRCSSGPARRVADAARRVARPASCFGANMTTLTLAFTRAVAATLRPATGSSAPGSTTTPTSRRGAWPASQAGAEHVLAPFDPATGRARPGRRDRPDRRAHAVGRRHRRLQPARHDPRPRRRSSPPPTTPAPGCSSTPCTSPRTAASTSTALGCDVLVTQPVQVVRPARRRARAPTRRSSTSCPSPRSGRRADRGPRRWETGTPSFEAIAAVDAAARFLLDEGLDRLAAAEAARLRPAARRAAGASHGVHGLGPADDGRPHADGRLHGRRARTPTQVADGAGRASASPRGPATPTPSRSSTSSASPTRAASCAPASSPTSTRRRHPPADVVERRAWACPIWVADRPSPWTIRAQIDAPSYLTAASMRARTSASSSGMTSRAAKFSITWLGRLAPVITVDTLRVRRAPGERQLGERAAELVGDRAQRARPWRSARSSDSRLASQP